MNTNPTKTQYHVDVDYTGPGFCFTVIRLFTADTRAEAQTYIDNGRIQGARITETVS